MMAAGPTTSAAEKKDDVPLLWEWVLVIILALIPTLPLIVGSGIVNTRAGGDSPFLLVRVHQLVLNLRAGVFPARWMPQAAYGLGYPFFNFYASLPYYLAAGLSLLGFGYLWAIKLAQALGFVFAAMTIYGFSRELRFSRLASLLVAFVYSCAPFHMVNVYVRGDSLSEFYAFIFFPLILWSLLRLQRQAGRENGFLASGFRSIVMVALSYAGLVLTHNISALIFTPFMLLYALLLIACMPACKRLRLAVYLLLSLGIGALFSAWFWLPILAERGNVYLKDMTTGYFHFAQHFRSLPGSAQAASLVQHSPVFDWAITADRQPFSMGLVQALLALAGVLALLVRWTRQHHVESDGAFLLFLLAASTFMITPCSRPVWESVPLLPMVQFPWRFLSIQALPASLVVAYLVPDRKGTEGRSISGRAWLIAFVLGSAVLGTMLLGLHPERLLIHEADITTQRLMLYEYFTANVGTTIRTDYLPRWVDPRPYTSEVFWQSVATRSPEGSKPAPIVLEGQVASRQLIAVKPTSERWIIEVTSPAALLAFHTYYCPGWQAQVDGQPAQIEALPGLGYIGLRLGPGRHQVSLSLGRTRAQLIAEALSALATIGLLGLLILDRSYNKPAATVAAVPSLSAPTKAVATGAVIVTLVALLLLAVVMRLLSLRHPEQQLLDLTMDFDRIPYLHHNPDGVHFGDVARLMSYDLSSEAVQTGEALTVTTHWQGAQSDAILARLALVSPAQHLFSIPQAVAVSEKALSGAAIQHVLQIPPQIPRGVYLLSLQLYNRQGEIRAVNAQGETLGTIYLLPVHVSGETLAGESESVLQRFGDCIALSSAETIQPASGTLEITLTWHVLASPPQNYKTALRLSDATGWEVARLDTQPGYGFYPTAMWRPDEMVCDHYTLPLDDGTPPGMQYRLDVTLYESASLRPIGSVRIPNVALLHPTVRKEYKILQRFGPALALSEAQLPKAEWEQGEEFTLVLKWAATAPIEHDYQCQVALLNKSGATVLSQMLPLAVGYPAPQWPRDAVVGTRYKLRLPSDVPAGEYAIALTVVEAASGSQAGAFTLPTLLRVVKSRRNFAIPQMQKQVGADFAQQVRLLGYDLQRTDKELRLTLHWQALSVMDMDYKLFVHLFDPTTEKIVAQQDVQAGGESHPTSRWVTQEVVSSSIALPLDGVPAGTYRLAVGLYHPGGRLPVVAPPELTVSADRLLLGQTVQIP